MWETNVVQAAIDADSIVIRVAIDTLPQLVDSLWGVGNLSVRYRVANVDKFAPEVMAALNRKLDENGETLVDRLFDQAIEDAIDNGGVGVEEYQIAGDAEDE
jgi:hypothetical protein